MDVDEITELTKKARTQVDREEDNEKNTKSEIASAGLQGQRGESK